MKGCVIVKKLGRKCTNTLNQLCNIIKSVLIDIGGRCPPTNLETGFGYQSEILGLGAKN